MQVPVDSVQKIATIRHLQKKLEKELEQIQKQLLTLPGQLSQKHVVQEHLLPKVLDDFL